MKDLKSRFTKWYVKKGYRFTYAIVGFDFSTEDLSMKYLESNPNPLKEIFSCPWWVRPLLCFFSPSVYGSQMLYKQIQESLKKGYIEGLNEGGAKTPEFRRFTPPPAPIPHLVDEWDKMMPLSEPHISQKHTKIFASGNSGGLMYFDEHCSGRQFIPDAVINVKEDSGNG